MRRNPDYMLKEVADTTVIVPVGQAAVDFPGMITVNETGRQLWELLAEERGRSELTAWLCERFQVEPWKADADVEVFLRRLRLAGALLEGADQAAERGE